MTQGAAISQMAQDAHMQQNVGQPIEKTDKNRKKRKINKPAKKTKGKKSKGK
jgi:hypothetical protein